MKLSWIALWVMIYASLLCCILAKLPHNNISPSKLHIVAARIRNQPISVPFDLFTNHEKAEKLNYIPRSLTDFTTRKSRLGFIRKVYAIFGTQMLTTILITYTIMTNHNIAQFLYENYQIIASSSFIISTGIIMSLVSNPKLRHKKPFNFILLGIHTILQSIIVGTFSSIFSPKMVCYGTIHTLTAFITIALYTFQPNPQYDFTILGNTLLTCLTTLLVGCVLNTYFHMPLLDNIFSGCLAIIFAIYLLYDMQMIVGGKHRKYQYGQQEYILAALNMYQNILSFYIQIMKLLHNNEKNKRKNSRSMEW